MAHKRRQRTHVLPKERSTGGQASFTHQRGRHCRQAQLWPHPTARLPLQTDTAVIHFLFPSAFVSIEHAHRQ
eukprot:121511-Pelagomonas_calceolata.AAC.1